MQGVDTQRYRPVPADYEARMWDEPKTVLEFGQFTGDEMSRLKDTYAALAMEPDHTRYGWIRTTV
ncbi:MAG: hypothetical protein O7I93_10885 [Gemmatimonadetes bacterium]|nr:hypothetical protein [Gemmatimonadota bacterium]